jgi:hypothetical protein
MIRSSVGPSFREGYNPTTLPGVIADVKSICVRRMNSFLMYDDVRLSESPEQTLLDFCQSTYDAAANLAQWNRAELERPGSVEFTGGCLPFIR